MTPTKSSSSIPMPDNSYVLAYYAYTLRVQIKRLSDIGDQLQHDNEVSVSTIQTVLPSLQTAKESLHDALSTILLAI